MTIPTEQRRKLWETAKDIFDCDCTGVPCAEVSAYLSGAQAAFEMREAEVAELKSAIKHEVEKVDQIIAGSIKKERQRIHAAFCLFRLGTITMHQVEQAIINPPTESEGGE